tara:strand:- start:479 stop:796 length:318 start_codon:yes stop_codon:yes gene_type:complete
MALGKTAQFYRDNPNSYKKKLAKANKHPVWGEQTSKRKEKKRQDGKARRKAKREGRNVEGQHWDIKTGTWMSEKENTGQAEKSRKRGSKRNKRNFGKSIKEILNI